MNEERIAALQKEIAASEQRQAEIARRILSTLDRGRESFAGNEMVASVLECINSINDRRESAISRKALSQSTKEEHARFLAAQKDAVAKKQACERDILSHAKELGTKIFAAHLAGEIPFSPLFQPRLDLHQTITELKSQNAASPAESGFFAKAKSKVGHLANSAKLMLEESRTSKADTEIGSKVLTAEQEESYYSPLSSDTINLIRGYRKQIKDLDAAINEHQAGATELLADWGRQAQSLPATSLAEVEEHLRGIAQELEALDKETRDLALQTVEVLLGFPEMPSELLPDLEAYNNGKVAIQQLTCEVEVEKSVVAELPAYYRGGHPEQTQSAAGVLRTDAEGILFSANHNAFSIRISFPQLLDVQEPKPGEMPSDVAAAREMQINRAATTQRLARFAGTLMGGTAGRAVAASGSLASVSGPTGRWINRLTVVFQSNGARMRATFDILGAGAQESSAAAEQFWNSLAPLRPKFGKAAAVQPNPAAAAAAQEQTAPAEHVFAKAATGTTRTPVPPPPPLTAPPPPPVTPSSIPTATETATPAKPVVIACPACQTKLRVKEPGIVGCPKCQGKLRVAPELFK